MSQSNFSEEKLIDESISRGEGILAANGALLVNTGKRTGRSPLDRFIVMDDVTKNEVDWGDINPVGDAAGIALPLATAAGAGLASTGLGSGAGMLTVGAAAMGGKAIDESIEYLRGKNLQTGPQVLGDIATEGALAATGEGVVRGLGAGVRYFIGGPGRKMRVLDEATGEYNLVRLIC